MTWKQNKYPPGIIGTPPPAPRGDVFGRHSTCELKCPPIKPQKNEASLL